MEAYEKIAQILRTDKHHLLKVGERLSSVTGKTNVFERLVEEGERRTQSHMLELGVSMQSSAKEVFEALISKIESDDYEIFKELGSPDCRNVAHCQNIAEAAKKIIAPPPGFFLKLDKAKEFILKEPPREVMAFLGYTSPEEMLAKEDLLEIYSALRFAERGEWLNNVFFKQYESLTPNDFEEREIQVRALGGKWAEESQKFVNKKHHNISHLKELGVIFIIPTLLGISGELLRMFALIMHYLYEVPFYSDIFRDIAKDETTFVGNFVSLLRGDVLEKNPAESTASEWLIVQRYLAKDDAHDWRLFVPHINPEAVHWAKAIDGLIRFGTNVGGPLQQLKFWADVSWVGDYFNDESGVPVLVSFDLVDTVMALVKQKQMAKYLYHEQEALWNKIFREYFGDTAPEDYSRKYILKGSFEI